MLQMINSTSNLVSVMLSEKCGVNVQLYESMRHYHMNRTAPRALSLQNHL